MIKGAKLTRRFENTVRQASSVSGFGFWSGRDVTVEFRPAAPRAGVVFVRSDLPGKPRIPADVMWQAPTARRTVLQQGPARVEMVEHVLAALMGMQVDNCEVWVDAPEMPGCDGSALPFVQALQAAGTVFQDATRASLTVRRALRVSQGSSWIEIRPAGQAFHLTYQLAYPQAPAIGSQCCDFAYSPEAFCGELAPARTFILEHEAALLAEQGLCRRVGYGDVLVFGRQGPIDNPLRFDDECARHKALDVVGDLALAGHDIIGHITAHRSGHKLNADFVRRLLKAAVRQPHQRETA